MRDLDGLRSALDGDLLTPSSPGYDAARRPALARFRELRPRAAGSACWAGRMGSPAMRWPTRRSQPLALRLHQRLGGHPGGEVPMSWSPSLHVVSVLLGRGDGCSATCLPSTSSPQSPPVVVRVNGSVTTSPSGQRHPLTGGVEQVLDDLERLRAVGVDHVFWAMDTEPEEQLAVMAELRRSI